MQSLSPASLKWLSPRHQQARGRGLRRPRPRPLRCRFCPYVRGRQFTLAPSLVIGVSFMAGSNGRRHWVGHHSAASDLCEPSEGRLPRSKHDGRWLFLITDQTPDTVVGRAQSGWATDDRLSFLLSQKPTSFEMSELRRIIRGHFHGCATSSETKRTCRPLLTDGPTVGAAPK